MELSSDVVKRVVAAALAEDVGDGDINAALITENQLADARIVTRSPGIFCGVPWMEETCRQVDPLIELDWLVADGDSIEPDAVLLRLRGPAPKLLTAERTMINFAQLLSGTATDARRYVDAVAHTDAIILDTRKTIPGLREAQKYAVAKGGAQNHRMGLFDAYLIKENHIAAAGSISQAVARARADHPEKRLEVEVETEAQLIESIEAGVDMILLDNHSVDELRNAVAVNAGRVKLEASGGITFETVVAVAETGVDYISIGAITKDVHPLDLSMLLETR